MAEELEEDRVVEAINTRAASAKAAQAEAADKAAKYEQLINDIVGFYRNRPGGNINAWLEQRRLELGL